MKITKDGRVRLPFFWLALAHLWASATLRGEVPVVAEHPGEMEELSDGEFSETPPLLTLGARFDASFAMGLPTQQGFSIPSLRLSADGEVSRHVAYHLWFGQTREFSTALLPQILPVEAAIEVSSGESGTFLPGLVWRIGMFTPYGSPWWTPDLGELDFPDYAEVQKSVLLSRDIGTELVYDLIPRKLSVSVGAFNGNGIFSLNSNNSRAFTAGLKAHVDLSHGSRFSFGSSAYSLTQSSRGAVNYHSVSIVDTFVDLDLVDLGLEIGGDFLFGTSEDSVRTTNPIGGVAFVSFEVDDFIRLFARGELLNSPPNGGQFQIRHFQGGPELELESALHLFIFYDYFEAGDGSAVNSGQARLRLVI